MKGISISSSITTRESESFKKYLREISNIEPFATPEEEEICAVKAWNGDESAKKELVKRNLRFVISCAKQYLIKGVTLEDLVNEGNIGMAKAAEKFNPTMGFKFITFAVWDIKKSIHEYLTNNSRTIRLPNNKVNALNKFKKHTSNLEQLLERPPSTYDIVEHYPEYSMDDVEMLYDLLYNETSSSLDMTIGDDGATLCDLVPDSSMGNADMLVVKGDMEVNINNILSTLKPMDRDIIVKLFGLDGGTPCTLADVGNMYSLSRESIRQRKESAFKLLRGTFPITGNDILND